MNDLGRPWNYFCKSISSAQCSVTVRLGNRTSDTIRNINRKENMKRKPGDLQFQFACSSCAQPKE